MIVMLIQITNSDEFGSSKFTCKLYHISMYVENCIILIEFNQSINVILFFLLDNKNT